MLVAVVIIAVAAAPLATVISNLLTQGADCRTGIAACGLGHGLMEEILSKGFEDPEFPGSFGPEEPARAGYDDVDDYNGLNDSPPCDQSGNQLLAYSGFRAGVAVENVAADNLNGPAAPQGSTSFKRVAVTVSWDGGRRSVRLVGLVSNFAPANPPLSGLTFLERVRGAAADLEFRVRNDTDGDIYLSHVAPTWSSPVAYYEQILVNVEGHTDYGVVWDYSRSNGVRAASAVVAMFNQGKVVLVPRGAVMSVRLRNFYNNRKGGGSTWNMEGTAFTVELWAAPNRYVPLVVPALP